MRDETERTVVQAGARPGFLGRTRVVALASMARAARRPALTPPRDDDAITFAEGGGAGRDDPFTFLKTVLYFGELTVDDADGHHLELGGIALGVHEHPTIAVQVDH